MQLINALVTSPDELDFRIHLRNEFLRCGLKKILPVSKKTVYVQGQKSLHLCVCIAFVSQGNSAPSPTGQYISNC